MDVGALYNLLMVGAGLAATNSITEFSKGLGKSAFEGLKSLLTSHGVKSVALIEDAATNPAYETLIKTDLDKPAIAADPEVERLALALSDALAALPDADLGSYAVKVREIQAKGNVLFRRVEGVLADKVASDQDITFEDITRGKR